MDEAGVGAFWGVGPETGQTVSRWYAIRALSAMRRKRENSSRTAIWVTRWADMACEGWVSFGLEGEGGV